MCDTLGFVSEGKSLFAKNSDRSPNEPQLLEYIGAAKHSDDTIKATYINVPQANETHGIFLSRPSWLWGGEIGVNDCGVAIGNEAVWTLGSYGDEALTGMDMLRLALERSSDATEAVKLLTELLETYGQGGNCGYDHEFFYDNSFLVQDANALYVLETAGKDWVYKKYDRASISNRLSIGSDGDAYSGDKCNFALKHTEHVYNIASGSRKRKCLTQKCLASAADTSDMMGALRVHDKGVSNPFASGTVKSTCMHFGGIVGDHTTSSVVADIKKGRTVIWATGCSMPCVSLFKPWVFGEGDAPFINCGSSYWYGREMFIRKLIGKKLPDEYYLERDSIEKGWIELIDGGACDITGNCLEEEKAFFEKWSKYDFEPAGAGSAFLKRWDEKTKVLLEERETAF